MASGEAAGSVATVELPYLQAVEPGRRS